MKYLRKQKLWYLERYIYKVLGTKLTSKTISEFDEICTLILNQAKKEIEEEKLQAATKEKE